MLHSLVYCNNNNNNNNNNIEDIYSIVIMTEVIAKVHSVHLVNIEQRQAAADPQIMPPDLGCDSAYRLLSSILLLLSPKADTHLPIHGG